MTSVKELSEDDEEQQLVNIEVKEDKLCHNKLSHNKLSRILYSDKCKYITTIMILVLILIYQHYQCYYPYDEESYYSKQLDDNPHYGGRRILKIHHVHKHVDTCLERDEEGKLPCCREDLRCWGFNYTPNQLKQKAHLRDYSKYNHEDETGKHCDRFKTIVIDKMVSDYNKYMGNKSFTHMIPNGRILNYFHVDNYVANMTRCNNSTHGCCQITNTCNNNTWTVGTPKKSVNDNICPSIKDLIYWENVDYPVERYDLNVAFLEGFVVFCLFIICLSNNKKRYHSI